MEDSVLVIGGGLAGMKASLVLSEAGVNVHLVESSSALGGRLVRSEDVYPAMECATCMLAPLQQEVLGGSLINVHLLARVTSASGEEGSFTVGLASEATGVDTEACIGCGECWNVCPVTVPNDFEEQRAERHAISVPCAGALPNVPWIDRDCCVRFTSGEECTLCADACVFGAISFDTTPSESELRVSHIILATGGEPEPPPWLSSTASKDRPRIFTAPEFERLYASNGPTEGKLLTGDGVTPSSTVILVHPFNGQLSEQTSAYSLKFVHYLQERIPGIELTAVLDATLSGSDGLPVQADRWKGIVSKVVTSDRIPLVSGGAQGEEVRITCNEDGQSTVISADMLISACGTVPSEGTSSMADLLGLEKAAEGWPLVSGEFSTVLTSRPGVCIAGSALGPVGASSTVISAMAAAGRVLSGRRAP